MGEKYIKLYKESSGCFIIDPVSQKVIMTIKTIDRTKADVIRALIDNQVIRPETVLKVEKHCSFTKGKMEGEESYTERALKESEEEAGIAIDDIMIEESPIGSFEKKKRYTDESGISWKEEKKVTMYLAKLKRPYDINNLNPTDPRHVAIALDINKVSKLLKSKDEKNFRKSKDVQHEIHKYLKNINNLSLNNTTNDVTQIDA